MMMHFSEMAKELDRIADQFERGLDKVQRMPAFTRPAYFNAAYCEAVIRDVAIIRGAARAFHKLSRKLADPAGNI